MARVFLIVLGAGVVLLIVGALIAGAFPPKPVIHQVQHTIPNSTLAAPGP